MESHQTVTGTRKPRCISLRSRVWFRHSRYAPKGRRSQAPFDLFFRVVVGGSSQSAEMIFPLPKWATAELKYEDFLYPTDLVTPQIIGEMTKHRERLRQGIDKDDYEEIFKVVASHYAC